MDLGAAAAMAASLQTADQERAACVVPARADCSLEQVLSRIGAQ